MSVGWTLEKQSCLITATSLSECEPRCHASYACAQQTRHRLQPRSACFCSVDLVLVGAEGVVENGGIINRLGTFNIALAAAAHNKPFYVAAESYKVSSSSCYQIAASE